jgi:hypothetical protein
MALDDILLTKPLALDELREPGPYGQPGERELLSFR